MKKHLCLLLTLVIASTTLVGCVSTNCDDNCDNRNIAPRHAGHSSYNGVQIYNSKPAKAYQSLGPVSVTVDDDTSQHKINHLLKRKAADRGADAVIITKSYEHNGMRTVKGNAVVWDTKQHD